MCDREEVQDLSILELKNLYSQDNQEKLKTENEKLLQKRSDENSENVISWKPSEESILRGEKWLCEMLHIRQVR